jgi:hypothetical protein
VDSRILLCSVAVGAFILTLTFSSGHDGLWRHDAAPVARVAPELRSSLASKKGAAASNPFGASSQAATLPTAAAAPAAAIAAAIASAEPVQSEPHSAPDVDDGAMPARG